MNFSFHHKSAIIDTSVLIVLYHLDLLKYLKLFYNTVRIPRMVEKEFLTKNKDLYVSSKRYDFLMRFYQENSSWFLQCNEYGSDIIQIYLSIKKIDEGEAEAFAQNHVLGNNHEILLDEKEARTLAKNKNIQIHGVLFILANLDLKHKVCNYHESVKYAQNILNTRFSEKIVHEVYSNIKKN